jgi:hypothetical protein
MWGLALLPVHRPQGDLFPHCTSRTGKLFLRPFIAKL